ncbi:polysaccharide biosynthesis C-terminal domain-containing protein [Mesorhizobium mediterraneum]|uniref:polysaccharide biosynthesis C-terminal domain-containing protein n=1 Tax=Mesorhizobium mediterraneum TaxID=43617 RepID=UPI0017830F8C
MTFPSLLSYLGQERFGLWLLSLSLMGLLGFAFSGTAGATIIEVSRSIQDPSRKSIRLAATNSTAIALVFGSICALVGSIACWQFDLAQLFGLGPAIPRAEANSLFLALSILLGFGFPANVPKFVLIGMMLGQVAYCIELVGIAVAAAALLLAIHFKQPLDILAVAFLGPQYLLMLLGGGVKLYASGVPLFARAHFVRDKFFVMLREGWKLALGQASFAIASHTDLTLISVIIGAVAAAPYGVAQRVFGVPIMFLAMGNDALWPALARADANGESRWVRRAYLHTLVTMTLISSVAGIGIWLLYEPLTRLWLGRYVETSPLLLFGMAVYIVATMIVHTTATLLRSMGMTTFLTRALVAMMLLNIPMSIWLIHLIGAPGAIWGTVISYVVCLIIPFLTIVPRLLMDRKNQDISDGAKSEKTATSEVL